MIIRLIDVVLLVLFGFIVISDIDIKGSLPLPSKHRDLIVQRKLPVSVDIDPGDVFVVTQGKSKFRYTSASALEEALNTMKQSAEKRGESLVVVIRPHEQSTVQATVDVLDSCQRLGIPRNIARRSLAL